MFYRKNKDGDAVIFHDTDEIVRGLDLPIGSQIQPVIGWLGYGHENPEGIVLTTADAEKIGIFEEAAERSMADMAEEANRRLLAHSETVCTPGCLCCMDEWQRRTE